MRLGDGYGLLAIPIVFAIFIITMAIIAYLDMI